MSGALTRRAFVAGGALGALGLAAPGRVGALLDEVARGALPGGRGRFLSPKELQTLRAVTARLVPGPPEDPGPGALEVRAAEAIDLLLGAFTVDPPLIHAGGPFSGRAGGGDDDFSRFVALDAQAELGWRIRLEGSRGLPEREFAGPVLGLQEVYRVGLARLDRLARARARQPFRSTPGAVQDELLASKDAAIARLVAAAVTNTLEAVCGPPEYGGNHGLAGWRGLSWQGDAQPIGFTPEQVSAADPPQAGAALGARDGRAASAGDDRHAAPAEDDRHAALGRDDQRAVLAAIAPLIAEGRRG